MSALLRARAPASPFCEACSSVMRTLSTALTLGASMALLAATPVFADGGAGGTASAGTGGAGGTSSSTGAGGNGGDSSVSNTGTVNGGGGGGGAAGATGGTGGHGAADGSMGGFTGAGGAGGSSPGAAGTNGVNGATQGAGGGGGGAHGYVGATLPTGNVGGGRGGNGGASTGGGGGGGEGGYGAVITGGSVTGTISDDVVGGAGGNGGGANTGGTGQKGAGGDGGLGLQFTGSGSDVTVGGSVTGGAGGSLTGNGNQGVAGPAGEGGAGIDMGSGGNAVTIGGAVTGGNGGNPSVSGSTGVAGTGGVGIIGSNADVTVTGSGSVAGGLTGGDSSTRANAITFSGGSNNLTIESGYTITGNVVGTGTDKFTFGGTTSDTFDLALFGTQFTGFSTLGKTGTSTWTLTNGVVVSTLDIDAGKLTFATGSLLGSNADVASGATLSFNQTGTTTYGAVISGAGNFEQENAGGTVVFNTNQTYTGTTTIAGTLQLGSGGTTGGVSSSSDIVNNGALIVNRSNGITLGDISGNGTLTKQAGGTLTIIGDATFSSVSVTAGGLQIGNGGATGTIAGDIDLSSGTTLNFTRSGTVSYAGDVSGGGSFDNDGTGTTILTGAFTNTGTFAITSGTVQIGDGGSSGSVDLDIVNDGTLVWNKSSDDTYSNVISGSGSLTKSGSGELILTGISTYLGDTTITAGRLSVNGQIGGGSSTTYVDGGVLGGTGTILGSVDVNAGGTHAPGNSIGTQTISGSYLLNSGAILEIEVNDAGDSDQVIVGGTVNLTNAILQVIAAAGNYAPSTEYLIIDNQGGSPVNGSFTTITSNFAFLTPTVAYDGGDGDDVVLTLINTTPSVGFCSVAATANQCAVGNAVQNLGPGNPLYDAIIGQTVEGAQQGFNALSGEVHATVSSTLANDSHYVRDILISRLVQAYYTRSGGGTQTAALGGGGGPATAAGINGAPMMGLGMGSGGGTDDRHLAVSPITFWAQGYGAWADFDGNGNAAGANRTLGGFMSGMDAMFHDGWRGGAAIGYARTDVSVGDGRFSSADVDSYQIAAYTSGEVSSLVVRGGVVWSWSDIDTTRSVVFPGFFDRTEASYGGNTGQAFGEVALPLTHAHVTYEPFAGLAWVGVDTGGFVETGGPAALASTGSYDSVGYMSLGLRAAGSMVVNGTQVIPRGSVAWLHAFGDVDPDEGLAFATFGQSFVVSGVPLAQNSALIDAGFDVVLGPEATAGIFYTGQFADNVQDNSVSGRVNWRF
jgi:outer membrane autotransporter protein